MATNTLGFYNETFFAQEALIQLEKVMGMAGRVFRGYSTESKARGDTINIRRPASFVASDAPATASDLATESVSITLDKWKEVKFALTDKDLSLSAPQIITDHIRPAAVALADKIDQDLAGLFIDIPWVVAQTATPVPADVASLAKVFFDNKVPNGDRHYMIDGATQLAYQVALAATTNALTTDATLREGSMGRLFGFDVWANQNTPSHTSGTAADAVGAASSAAVGIKILNISSFEASGTVKIGDTFSIAGDAQRYVVTADATASTGTITGLLFEPGLKVATTGSPVVTFVLPGAAKAQTLAFHRNAFALATAPLSDIGNQLGAKIAVVSDPITNISLRSRMYYVGGSSQVEVALDVLYGFKTLDRNLAVRGYDA